MGDNQENKSNQTGRSLTHPHMNEENHSPDQPRQPANLPGLLRYAMDAARDEDPPSEADFSPIDYERRKFLEDALSSLTVDTSEVLKTALQTLTDQVIMREIQLGDEVPENVRTAFLNILALVDDMDNANDFFNLGGFSIFPVCLGNENETVRALACSVLGEVCQNNPYCQARALEYGLVTVVLSLAQTERGEALVKELYALSCACREFAPACEELVAGGGCEVLAQALSAEEPAARVKAAFLARYLCHSCNDAREKFINQNLVKTVATQLRKGRDAASEHLLSILLALLEGREAGVLAQCADPAVRLRGLLEAHAALPDLQDDAFREEKERCEELIALLDGLPNVHGVEAVDR